VAGRVPVVPTQACAAQQTSTKNVVFHLTMNLLKELN
jgi:hypothetical protein